MPTVLLDTGCSWLATPRTPRSILEIYNLVRAEYGHATTGNDDFKFAWGAGLEYPDIEIEAVATAIMNMEKAGSVTMTKKAPAAPAKKK